MLKKLLFVIFLLTPSIAFAQIETLGLAPISAAVSLYIHWKDGEAHKVYDLNRYVVYNAAIASLNEMNLPVKTDKGNQIYAGHNNRFKIRITEMEPNITKLSVRINIMGDKPYAELFYQIVDKKLQCIDFSKKNPTLPIDKKRHRRR